MVWPRFAPKAARMQQASSASPPPWGAQQLRLHEPSPLPGHKAPQAGRRCSVEVWARETGAELWYPAQLGMEVGLSWNVAIWNLPCSEGSCSPGARVLLEGIFSKLRFTEGYGKVEHQHLEELSFRFQSCRSNTLTYLWEQSAPLSLCVAICFTSPSSEK